MRRVAGLLAVTMLFWACGGDSGETPIDDTAVMDTGSYDTTTPPDTGQDNGVTVDSTITVDIPNTVQPIPLTEEEYAYADIGGVHVDFAFRSANYYSYGRDAGLHLNFKTADGSKALLINITPRAEVLESYSPDIVLGNHTNDAIHIRVVIIYTDRDVSYRGEWGQEGTPYSVSVDEFGDQGDYVSGEFEAKLEKIASDPSEYLEIVNGAYRIQRGE